MKLFKKSGKEDTTINQIMAELKKGAIARFSPAEFETFSHQEDMTLFEVERAENSVLVTLKPKGSQSLANAPHEPCGTDDSKQSGA